MSVENRDLRCYVTQAGFNQEALDKQLGRSTDLTHLVIDGTLLPDGSSPAALVAVQDEARRYLLSRVEIDEQNPSMLIVEAIIPADDGGFNINGIGIETSQGVLYAYARSTGDYKPLLESGQGSDLVLRVQFLPGNADQITLQVDPTAVLATVDFVVQRTQAATETAAGVVEKATTEEAKGGAADKFPDAAGVHAAFKQFGLGVAVAGVTDDLDALAKTGLYNANINSLNIPSNSSGTVLHIEGAGAAGSFATQLFVGYGVNVPAGKNRMHVRHKDDAVWEPWHEVFNTGGGLPAATETAIGAVEKATTDEAKNGTADKFPDAAGVLAAFGQFGLGAKTTVVDDLNELLVPGIYDISLFALGLPVPGKSGACIVAAGGTGGFVQIWLRGNVQEGDQLFIRHHKGGGEWTQWCELYHSGNDGEGSGLDADLVRGLPADFTGTMGSNGTQKLPSGKVEQWGVASTPTGALYDEHTIAFNIDFPNACDVVFVIPVNSAGADAISPQILSKTEAQFSIRLQDNQYCDSVYWHAIGH